MSEYLGQVLSYHCLQRNSFEVKILIDTKENFNKIMDYYQFEKFNRLQYFTI